MTALEAIVTALAVYRLTLLVVADTITGPWRSRLTGWAIRRKHGTRPVFVDELYDGPTGPEAYDVDRRAWETNVARRPPWLAGVLDCPWCASPYAAVVAVAGTLWVGATPGWWLVYGTAAASGVTGLLASKASP